MNALSPLIVALCAATAPSALLSAPVDAPESELVTFASYFAQGGTVATDDDVTVGRAGVDVFESESLVSGLAPFPNATDAPDVPNSLGTGFASAAGASNGEFGVGVNAFFGPSSKPQPHELVAIGGFTQDLFNDSGEVREFGADFFIPAPTIYLTGQIGDFFPPGVDPIQDVTAEVRARITTTLTRTDGTTQQDVVFEYGMRTGRDSQGRLGVTTTPGAGPAEVVGFKAFELPAVALDLDTIAVLAPGESVKLDFSYLARGGTGFGETGVFAAIGDPFAIASGGGRFAFSQGDDGVDPPPPLPPTLSPVPLPASLPLLGLGVGAMRALRRRTST